eukprot:CAMPEP_0177789076 /NCGR_PEP_ID=MMETSP0491_2-20121128/22520_1 /TAXON_ID=63592 /ORGANISM="Tetraselmis chuii, Strain PLY429" /LENGTH=475 /DNA_ID=CAMNT_0019310843 /DNA_START=79 /DNA_END=1505 /DNA_ORIENTATION=-
MAVTSADACRSPEAQHSAADSGSTCQVAARTAIMDFGTPRLGSRRAGQAATRHGAAERGSGVWAGESDESRDARPKRILLMWSATGGGHRASAEAVKAGIEELYGDKYHVDSVDMWADHMEWPTNQLGKAYNFAVKNSWVWKCVFNAPEPLHEFNNELQAKFNDKKLGAAFQELRPELVVSLHPVMQHVPLRVLGRLRKRGVLNRPPAFATVVTDLSEGCHHLWFHKGVDRCFVPIEEVKEKAVRRGLSEEQVTIHGLPVRPAFAKEQLPKAELRQWLGLETDAKIALLVGGGEGMGPLIPTLQAIKESGCACQLVVICGKNAKLQERVAKDDWGPHLRLCVQGFVTNMNEWMAACDCIITKAGPGTIAEALICGLPILLNAFIPCQEEGNIPYVQNYRVGTYKSSPKDVAATLKQWFSPEYEAELHAMAERAREIAKPQATFDICRSLVELLEDRTAASSAAGVSSSPPVQGSV